MSAAASISTSFAVQEVPWAEHCSELAAIRREVFVVEQKVPEELEWDGVDAECRHVLARAADGRPIGTGRLMADGRIGRMAVLKPWRGAGVGAAMLAKLVDMARQAGFASTVLHAQTRVVPFYAKYGFVAEGPEFTEAGIAHRKMRLGLSR